MAKVGLLEIFEDGFYDAWAPDRPELHHWESELQPAVVFQILLDGWEMKYMVDEMVLTMTRSLYHVGYEVGKATKRAMIAASVPEGGIGG